MDFVRKKLNGHPAMEESQQVPSQDAKELNGLPQVDRWASRSVDRDTGLGFMHWLQLILITLKLCGILEWSWFWVLSPIWATLLFGVVVLAVMVAVAVRGKA